MIIPVNDPNPLQTPFWVFKTLSPVTIFLHMLAMNFLLGSGVFAIVAKIKSKSNPHYQRLFQLLFLFTLGVAPLLFVQVTYGQCFNTSTILIAWVWLLVLIFLSEAYYGFYFISFLLCEESIR